MTPGSTRYGILGPFELSVENRVVEIDQPKPRALLARLVVDANTVVSAGRLIDDLWEHDPPRSSVNTLHTYVHKLRALLPPGALVTRDGGYRLELDPPSVDAVRFGELVDACAARAGDPRGRARSLRQALNLWRGEALADFAGADWARPAIARLEEARLHAWERCVETELQLGRHGEVLGELNELVHRSPLRERFYALQMLALYRSGRQADALRAYQRLRIALSEELGIEPSESLVELERSILLHDPHIDASRSSEGFAVPLSARVVAASRGVFVGRACELELLEESLKEVTAGQRTVVLITGEPGIGKTSLAATFAAAASDSCAIAAYGHSDADLGIPFQPWNEVIAHLIEHAPDEVIDAHVAVHGGALARLVPELVERSPLEVDAHEDIESQRHRLFGAVADLLTRLGAIAPVLIILDDLHWADRSSVELLQFLVARDRPQRVLIIATLRSSELGSDHALSSVLDTLTRLPAVHRIGLSGLDDDELLALLETTSGEHLPGSAARFRDALMRETDGNPFFVIEILHDLADSGASMSDVAADATAVETLHRLELPDGVRRAIGNRAARLGRDTPRVLSVAAVIGREFDLEVLAPATGVDRIALVDECERCVNAAILEHTERPGRYGFAHALIQRTFYQDLSITVCHQLHQRIGEVLEERFGDGDERVSQLAHHWLAAYPSDTARAVKYARRAGDLAVAALAPSEAARLYRRALELIDDDAELNGATKCELLIALGRAESMAGDREAHATALAASTLAQQLGSRDLLVAAALAGTRGDFNQSSAGDAELTSLTLAALAAVGDEDSEDRVRLLEALMEQAPGSNWELARSRALAAVETARRLGDDRVLMGAITSTYVARAQPDTLRERLTDTSRALLIAEEIGDPLDRFNARFTRHAAVMEAADVDDADVLLAEMEQIAASADLSLPHVRFRLLMLRAGRRVLEGDHTGAEHAANDLIELGTATNLADAFGAGGALLTLLNHERGRIRESIDQFAAAAQQTPDLAVLRAALAFYLSEAGRLSEAGTILTDEHATLFEAIPYDINWTTSMTLFGDCAATLGDRDAAVTIRARLAPFASGTAYNGLTSLGALSRVLGRLDMVLDNRDAAKQELEYAIAVNTRLGAPFPTARAQLELANLLTLDGEPDRPAIDDLVRASANTSERFGFAELGRCAARLGQLSSR